MNEKGEMPEEPFIKGEPVKVMAGPFNGFTGVIDEIYEDKKKLKGSSENLWSKYTH